MYNTQIDLEDDIFEKLSANHNSTLLKIQSIGKMKLPTLMFNDSYTI